MRQFLLPCAMLCLVAQSCPTLCDSIDCSSPCPSVHGDPPGKNTGVRWMPSSRESSQPKDLTQVSCTAGRFLLSHKGSPRKLEWDLAAAAAAAYPFSSGSPALRAESLPRGRPKSPCPLCVDGRGCLPGQGCVLQSASSVCSPRQMSPP